MGSTPRGKNSLSEEQTFSRMADSHLKGVGRGESEQKNGLSRKCTYSSQYCYQKRFGCGLLPALYALNNA